MVLFTSSLTNLVLFSSVHRSGFDGKVSFLVKIHLFVTATQQSLTSLLQRTADSGGGDGAGHRHVLPFPADQSHEELPAAARDVSNQI